MTYNTSLGQNDPDVIKIIQSGVKDFELRKQLMKIAVFKTAFESLWVFANQLAAKYHLETVNVALEHSEHGDHKARVHFHFFMGLDLSKGVSFSMVPGVRMIPKSEFDWGSLVPDVSATNTSRKSWQAIYNAVATGSYYVAGPKSSVILKRSTLQPIEDDNHSESRRVRGHVV